MLQSKKDRHSRITSSGIHIPNLKETTPHHSETSIRQVLSEVKPDSTIKLFARSASTWAEMYSDIQNAIDAKNIHVEVVIADDNAVMATDEDHGQDDVAASVKKFKRIKLSKNTRGTFSLYRNPTFLLFSYVAWEDKDSKRKSWLTMGASLSKPQQLSLEFHDPSPYKKNLDEIYEKVRLRSKMKGFTIDANGLKELSPQDKPNGKGKIFIVHGQNIEIRNKIDLYLTKELHLSTCIMQADPQKGRTLPEKFEEMASDCSFAVFILTADDQLTDHTSAKEIKRARQNVILEIGYFWGALGRRGRTVFLVENDPNMDLPTDISGMGWIPITSDLGETKLRLNEELKEAGLI